MRVFHLASSGGGRRVVFVFNVALAFMPALYACTYLRTIMSDSAFLLLAFPARVRYPTVTDQRSVTEARRSQCPPKPNLVQEQSLRDSGAMT